MGGKEEEDILSVGVFKTSFREAGGGSADFGPGGLNDGAGEHRVRGLRREETYVVRAAVTACSVNW